MSGYYLYFSIPLTPYSTNSKIRQFDLITITAMPTSASTQLRSYFGPSLIHDWISENTSEWPPCPRPLSLNSNSFLCHSGIFFQKCISN